MRRLANILTCLIVFIESTGNKIHSKSSSTYLIDDADIEQYFVEHAISTVDAKDALNNFNTQSLQSKAGCQQCSPEEIKYCTGPKVMNDHCCCDKRYNEFFSYVPHICYLGKKVCQPIAKDCAEYTRLRTCCCDKIAFKTWKMILSSGPKININLYLILYLTILIYFVS